MTRRDLPYPQAPTVGERLARIEERLDGLIDRVDGIGRTVRFTIGVAIAAATAIVPLVVVVIR